METSFDYGTNEKLILFDYDEDPLIEVPEGWEILERSEPYIYKGFKNLGSVICCPPKNKQTIQTFLVRIAARQFRPFQSKLSDQKLPLDKYISYDILCLSVQLKGKDNKMITYINVEDRRVATDGCGCCSSNLDLDTDIEEIISHLAQQLAVLDEVLEFYGMEINTLRRTPVYIGRGR